MSPRTQCDSWSGGQCHLESAFIPDTCIVDRDSLLRHLVLNASPAGRPANHAPNAHCPTPVPLTVHSEQPGLGPLGTVCTRRFARILDEAFERKARTKPCVDALRVERCGKVCHAASINAAATRSIEKSQGPISVRLSVGLSAILSRQQMTAFPMEVAGTLPPAAQG